MLDMMKMMGKFKEAQEKMKKIKEELDTIEASSESGAGLVKVTVNGKKELISIEIDDSILSEQVVEKVTCDDNIVFGSFEDDFDGFTFGSCDVCKNVCVPTLSMSGGVKMCGQKQMVSLNASFDEKYTGPECFIKVRLETEGDSSSGYPADTLYTYLRAIPGEVFLGLREIELPQGTWKATINIKDK